MGSLTKESSLTSLEARRELRYAGVIGHWDEALLPSGMPRRHWRRLAAALGRMGLAELNRSWVSAQRLIQAKGSSFSTDDDLYSQDHPWEMDAIPLVIAGNEWASIERAVVQRATLLNAILADLYGDGPRLLREARLPPALLFANPQFLRPCRGLTPPGGLYLHSLALDLARSPDGRWWAIGTTVDSPSGMGYTLENRLVSARTLPDVFRQGHVRQLARFFDRQRDAR